MKNALWIMVIVSLLMLSTVSAELSVQLKRTNPGVPRVQPSELIFDVVNTDLTHQVQGFLLCQSPDDAVISSTYGVGSGSGAQYLSPVFFMDVGPTQEAMTLTLNADSPGDKRASCSIKYIMFKMVETQVVDEETGESTTEEVKQYLKIDGEYGETADDVDYLVYEFDKTVPFVRPCVEDVACPSGTTHCTYEDLKCPVKLNIFQRFWNWLTGLFG